MTTVVSGASSRPRKRRSTRVDEAELERLLEEIRAQHEQLAEENRKLRSKLGLLETVVPKREQCCAYLSGLQPAHQPSPLQLPAAPTLETPSAQSSPPPRPDHLLQPSSSLSSPGSGSVFDLDGPALDAALFDDLADLEFCSPIMAQPVVLDPRQMSPKAAWEHMLQTYRTFCRDASGKVMAAEVHGAGHPSSRDLEQLLREQLGRCTRTMLAHPRLFFSFKCLNLETGQREDIDDGYWMRVVRSLHLTPDQVHGCEVALGMFEKSLAALRPQKQELWRRLTHGLAAAQQAQPGKSAMQHSRELEALVEVESAAAQLDACLFRQHQTHCNLADFLCGGAVLTPVQVAKICVVSYPFAPDIVAVAYAIKQLAAEQEGSKA